MNIGILDKEFNMKFYLFKEPAISSFNEEISLSREKSGCKIDKIFDVKVNTLEWLFDNYLPKGKDIDFFIY